MKQLWKKYLKRLHEHDRGTVAVTFLLTLPILLWVLAIIIQWGLIVNAQITLNAAAAAAARSAMTALPTDPQIDAVGEGPTAIPFDGAAAVKRAACLRLTSISPVAPNGDAPDDLVQALQNAGASLNPSFASRYAYADAATEVHWQIIGGDGTQDPPPSDLCKRADTELQFTVTYKFHLNVPGAKWLVGHNDTDVAGVTGNYVKLSVTYNIQLSYGREANGG